MYFIVKNNRVYNVMIHIHPFIRYFSTVLVITIILALWLFTLYFPFEKKICYYNTAIKQAHQQSRKIDALHCSNTKTNDIIDRLNNTLYRYDTQSCRKKDMHKIVSHIFKIAHACNLTIHNYSVQPLHKKSDHHDYPVHLSIEGKLNHILTFFIRLKELKKMISYTYVTMTSLENDMYKIQLNIHFIETDYSNELKKPLQPGTS